MCWLYPRSWEEAVNSGWSPCPHGVSSPPPRWPDMGTYFPDPLKVFAFVINWEWAVTGSWSVESTRVLLTRSVVPFRRQQASSWGRDWKKKLHGNWTRSLWLVGVPVQLSTGKHKLEPMSTWGEFIPSLGNQMFLACSTGVLLTCLDVSTGVDGAPTGREDKWDLISCVIGAGHPTSSFLS